jgi:hypothetical protein
VLPEVACQFALEDPQGTSVLQSVIPESSRKLVGLPTEAVTNEAFFGVYTTNGLAAAFQMRTGRLASAGSPRRWISGPYSSVPSVCKTFTQEPDNGFEWYYPARLDVDLFQGMPTLTPTGATRYLGLRPYHLKEVNVPLYAFQTGISKGGVLRGTKIFIRRSKVKSHWLYQDLQMGHFDPLEDFPAHNRFIATVVPWLRDLVAGRDPGSRASRWVDRQRRQAASAARSCTPSSSRQLALRTRSVSSSSRCSSAGSMTATSCSRLCAACSWSSTACTSK